MDLRRSRPLPVNDRPFTVLNDAQKAYCRHVWKGLKWTGEYVPFTDEYSLILSTTDFTKRLAGKLVDHWQWLEQRDPNVQPRLSQWRRDWEQRWRRHVYGVGNDVTLLPEAWTAVARLLRDGIVDLDDFVERAADLINDGFLSQLSFKAILESAEDIQASTPDNTAGNNDDLPIADLMERIDPVDPNGCFVLMAKFLDKPRNLRTPRAQRLPEPFWAVPRATANQSFRCLPSRRPDESSVYIDTLMMSRSKTPQGRLEARRIRRETAWLLKPNVRTG